MTRYADIRDSLRTGHVVLWQGDNWFSRLIRLKSRFSHASLVVTLDECQGLKDRVWLVESLGEGVCVRLLSERLDGYNGRASILMPRVSPVEQLNIRDFAMSCAGKGCGYDFLGLFDNIYGRAPADDRRMFCSELVWAAWRKAKPDLPDHGGKAPTPGDLPSWLGGELVEVKA